MKVEVRLFGAFRDCAPDAQVTLEVPAGARVADVREALSAHGHAHWPDFKEDLLRCSAFASETAVLRDSERLPDPARIVVLPPVGGG